MTAYSRAAVPQWASDDCAGGEVEFRAKPLDLDALVMQIRDFNVATVARPASFTRLSAGSGTSVRTSARGYPMTPEDRGAIPRTGRLRVEAGDAVEHVEGHLVRGQALGRSPDRQPGKGFTDIATGLGRDHPRGLMNCDAERLAGPIRHAG